MDEYAGHLPGHLRHGTIGFVEVLAARALSRSVGGVIVSAMVHTCPRCELRFETDTELEDHLEVDHHLDIERHAGDPDDDPSRPL